MNTRLRELREEQHLTQVEVAGFLHVKQNTYSQYESAKREIPLELLVQLSKFYNVSVDYILYLTNHKERVLSFIF